MNNQLSTRRMAFPSRLVLVFAGCLTLVYARFALFPPAGLFFEDDFIEYWTATRITFAGYEPYDPVALLRQQKEIRWLPNTPRMMLNPPHMLTVALVFGLLDYRTARWLWITSMMLLLIISTDLTWRQYGGSPGKRVYAWLISIAFAPSLMMLHFGQLGSIMLFGLAWFHHFQRRGNDLAASIFLPLVALKPQLSLLFCLALAVWAIYNRHWKVLIGAAFSAICMAALPLFWNPQIWMQYLRAMQTNSVGEWITPTIGAVFRLAFGWSKFCLQFLPPALGALSIAHHW